MPNDRIISIEEITEMKRLLDQELAHRGGTNSIYGLQGGQNSSAAPVLNNYITPAQANGLGKTFEIIQDVSFSVNPNDSSYQFPEADYERMETGVYSNLDGDHVMPESGTKEKEKYIDDASSGCRVTCQGLCSTTCYGGCRSGCGGTCSGGCTAGANANAVKTVNDTQTAPAENKGPYGTGCNNTCGKTCGGTCANTCTGQCSKGCSGSCATGARGY